LAPAGKTGSKDFKERISSSAVAGLGAALSAAWPDFPEAGFVGAATSGLDGLELKARVTHVADALAATLPDDFERATGVIRAAMESPDFDGWIVFPVNDWVARYGLSEPDLALPLLGELTSRWTAEYAVRPFIETHPVRTFEEFDLWIESPDEHRRRLVSEGSRPRLPWATQLRRFIEDPAPTIALIDRLVDDPSAYVRKSVANHLNDITKDHPGLAISTAARWLDEATGSESDSPGTAGADSGRRRWIVSHGLRGLVKAGDPQALRLLGFDPDAPVRITALEVSPDEIEVGEVVRIAFSLTAEWPADATRPGESVAPADSAPRPGATETQNRIPVMVDYAIHHAGARGRRSPKVFKLRRTTLEPGVETRFRKEHRIREVSVRRIHPGPHLIEIQVNGKALAEATVQVNVPKAKSGS
jgi:3-methyladenine DNA glycosylase AlkC